MALFQYFSRNDLEHVHETVLRLMNEVGVRFPHEPALQVLKKAGCRVDGDRVRFPANIVEDAVRKAPSKFTIYGRNPEQKVEIGGDNMVFLPCYGAPIVEDIKQGRRNATLEDLIRFIKLNHSSKVLPIIGGPMVEPNDVPTARRTAERIFAAMKYSDKPFMGGVLGREEARRTIDMAAMVMSGEKLLAERPPCISLLGTAPPLAWDCNTLAAMLEYTSLGIPVLCNTMAIAGMTAPVTLESSLVVHTAEVLSGVTLAQSVREGTPVVFSGASSCANLRDGLMAAGAPELGIFTVAAAQMGRFYNLPVRAGGASTDSKMVDVQAGYESMSNLLMSTLGGVNFVLLSAGVLDSYMVSSFEKFIVDEEMISMCLRIRRGEQITAERLAYDVIVEGAEKCDFLSHPHTFENFRTELHDPALSFRSSYDEWVEKGRPDILETAHQKWNQRLSDFQAPDLPPELEKDLRKYVDNIACD
jgi:trimethylamine--corrinoid protein Co-methyltransferase